MSADKSNRLIKVNINSDEQNVQDDQSQDNLENYTSIDIDEPMYLKRINNSIASSSTRWCLLALVCFYRFGTYFCMDQPATIEHAIIEGFDITTAQYGLLYTMNYAPNIILPFIAGAYMDADGLNKGIIMFMIFVTIGQIIVMTAGYIINYDLLLAGRLVFALGYEPINVAKTVVLAKWFKGKELNTAMNTSLCFARFCVLFTGFLTPLVTESVNIGTAFAVGLATCVIALGASIYIVVLNMKLQAEEMQTYEENFYNHYEHDQETTPYGGCCDKTKHALAKVWRDVKSFKYQFWLLCATIVMVYISILPPAQMVSDMLIEKYSVDQVTAGIYFGIISATGGITLLIIGFVADRYGKLPVIMIIASIGVLVSHIMWFFLPYEDCITNESCQYIVLPPLITLGLSYGLFAGSSWNCIVFLVPLDKIGSAKGTTTSLMGVVLASGPPLLGWIQDLTYDMDQGYYWAGITSCITSSIGILLCIAVYVDDVYKNNSTLNKKQQNILRDSGSVHNGSGDNNFVTNEEKIYDQNTLIQN